MREIHTAASERPLVLDKKHQLVRGPEAQFTPGPFFKEVAVLIGKVLFLFLFCKVLLMMVGVY